MTTKEKIMRLATAHFNRVGYAATNLHELANEIGMSRGNLAYHFKDKTALLRAIASEMWSKMEKERGKSRQFPSFENLHHEVQLYFRFQKEYAFIFLDPSVLKHTSIQEQLQEMTRRTILDNKAAIAFAIRLENMKSEPIPGMYHNIAVTVWMLSFFWLAQQIIRGEMSREDGEKMIWSLLIPHFTEKGKKAFRDFFGSTYSDSLGPAFELDMDRLISF